MELCGSEFEVTPDTGSSRDEKRAVFGRAGAVRSKAKLVPDITVTQNINSTGGSRNIYVGLLQQNFWDGAFSSSIIDKIVGETGIPIVTEDSKLLSEKSYLKYLSQRLRVLTFSDTTKKFAGICILRSGLLKKLSESFANLDVVKPVIVSGMAATGKHLLVYQYGKPKYDEGYYYGIAYCSRVYDQSAFYEELKRIKPHSSESSPGDLLIDSIEQVPEGKKFLLILNYEYYDYHDYERIRHVKDLMEKIKINKKVDLIVISRVLQKEIEESMHVITDRMEEEEARELLTKGIQSIEDRNKTKIKVDIVEIMRDCDYHPFLIVRFLQCLSIDVNFRLPKDNILTLIENEPLSPISGRKQEEFNCLLISKMIKEFIQNFKNYFKKPFENPINYIIKEGKNNLAQEEIMRHYGKDIDSKGMHRRFIKSAEKFFLVCQTDKYPERFKQVVWETLKKKEFKY